MKFCSIPVIVLILLSAPAVVSTGSAQQGPAAADTAAVLAADSTAGAIDSTSTPQAADQAAAPAGLSAAADTTAGTEDSTPVLQAADSAATPAGLSAAADTTAGAADSTSVPRRADSLAVPAKPRAAADTTAKPKAAADTTAKPQKKVRPPGDRVIAEIIPWDWDEYTNVIEVGLRRDDGREYSLTKNEFYQTVFDNIRLKVLAIGKVTSDPEGFYEMTVEYLEPADSTQSLAAKKSRRP